MRILYAIQGTGNGHLSRAREIIPLLMNYGEVDLLVSGTQADVCLPYDIDYRFKGMSFVFGKKGGIDLGATYKQLSTRRMMKDIASLPVEEYQLILNDFEPVSAWACQQKRIPCISLSHQSAVINKLSPKPAKNDFVGRLVLNFYAPCSASYGFHFQSYGENIFTPVIRSEVRTIIPTNQGHYAVYLPAYDDERIIRMLSRFKKLRWQVFSKHTQRHYTFDNINIQPIDNENFLSSLASCQGVLCGAGFETPAEALYLKKKLAVIPMKTQYEQQCNAQALREMGVAVFKSLKEKHYEKILNWVNDPFIIPVDFPDVTDHILQQIIRMHAMPSLHQGVAARPFSLSNGSVAS